MPFTSNGGLASSAVATEESCAPAGADTNVVARLGFPVSVEASTVETEDPSWRRKAGQVQLMPSFCDWFVLCVCFVGG